MQPEARTQANVLTTILHRSCLKNVALNYLVDGTFDFDDRLLANHIDLLTENNRRLFLYFYMTNGPAQRRGDDGSYKTFGNDVSPKRFRTLIQYDPEVREEYKALVDRLAPSILYAQSRGAVVSIIPMLEDNLNDEAFEAMVDLTLEALPLNAYVSIGRNPCPSCEDGNSYGVPDGVFLEVHTASPYINLSDVVITNDGYTYADSDSVTPNSLTLGEMALLRDRAVDLNSVFILWNAKRQGLDTEFSGGILPEPAQRDYPIPSITERRELLDFLQGY
jgi:hypothetical protein